MDLMTYLAIVNISFLVLCIANIIAFRTRKFIRTVIVADFIYAFPWLIIDPYHGDSICSFAIILGFAVWGADYKRRYEELKKKLQKNEEL